MLAAQNLLRRFFLETTCDEPVQLAVRDVGVKDRMSKVKQGSVIHSPVVHDSAIGHVTGEAVYVDDILEPAGTAARLFRRQFLRQGHYQQHGSVSVWRPVPAWSP